MSRALWAAAVWNAAIAALLVTAPAWTARLAGLDPAPSFALDVYIALIGLSGAAGFAVAAFDPLRYWPIVLFGLGTKVAGPAMLAAAALEGEGMSPIAWAVLGADAAFAVPFVGILREASRRFIGEAEAPPAEPRERMMLRYHSQDGYSLYELSQLRPTLVVFLRHAGCTFCREAVSDLARLRPEIERRGAALAFVSMSAEDRAREFFDRYGLGDAPRFHDPDGALYRSFDLRRGQWRDLFGWEVWKRGWQAGVVDGHGLGAPEGDPFRLPGVFLLHHGRVVRAFRHGGPADRPDYVALADCRECDPAAQAA